MKNTLSRLLASACLGALVLAGCDTGDAGTQPQGAMEVKGLQTPAAFADIGDDGERAAALFLEMEKVLQHPRCANCHPVSDRPTQGDIMRAHMPPVTRGPGGMGVAGMECSTCHGTENVEFTSMEGSIPGAEGWHLAPLSMGWVGLSAAALCAQIKDTDRNGGKSLDDLIEHNAEDHLVGWGWHPGEGREPAPGDQETFGALTAAWVEAGAHCPVE